MAMFCSGCGAPLKEDARFCGACGAPAVQQETAPAADEEAVVEPVSGEAPEAQPVSGEVPEAQPVSGEAPEAQPVSGEAPEAQPVSGEVPETQPVSGEAPEAQPASGEAPEAQPVSGETAEVRKPARRRPGWVLPVCIAAVVIAAGLAAAALILKNTYGPEKTVERFMAAMEDGDFAALADIAAPADEDIAFTAESAEPMFELYAKSVRFRRELEDCLEDDLERIADGDEPDDGNLVDLVEEKRFLHKVYTVAIETCDVTFSSNLLCTVMLDNGVTAQIVPPKTDGADSAASDEGWNVLYGPDYDQYCRWGDCTIYDLLPGRYQVKGTVETSFGDVFEAAAELSVMDVFGASGELIFDYQELEVYNDSSVDVELYIGGQLYLTAPMDADCYIAPILPDTEVEARAVVDMDEPMVETFTCAGSDGYVWLDFVLCEVDIINEYELPLYVYQDGAYLQKVEAFETANLTGLPVGTELEVKLYEQNVMETYRYVCEYEYDFFQPEFVLTAESQAAVDAAVNAYVVGACNAFNLADTDALGAMAETGLRTALEGELEYLASLVPEEAEYTLDAKVYLRDEMQRSYTEIGMHTDSAPTVTVGYEIPYTSHEVVTYADGTAEVDDYDDVMDMDFTVQYDGSVWEVIG